MFAKLKNEKLGSTNSLSNSNAPASPASSTESTPSSIPRRPDANHSIENGSDPITNGSEKGSPTDEVAFLQGKLKELLPKMKVLKREKDKAERDAQATCEEYEKRFLELKTEGQKKQDQMLESFNLSLRQKDMDVNILQRRLSESERTREKFLKKGEESDELKDFQNQELAKVKHMLINTQNEMARLQGTCDSEKEIAEKESQHSKEMERRLQHVQESLEFKTAQLR